MSWTDCLRLVVKYIYKHHGLDVEVYCENAPASPHTSGLSPSQSTVASKNAHPTPDSSSNSLSSRQRFSTPEPGKHTTAPIVISTPPDRTPCQVVNGQTERWIICQPIPRPCHLLKQADILIFLNTDCLFCDENAIENKQHSLFHCNFYTPLREKLFTKSYTKLYTWFCHMWYIRTDCQNRQLYMWLTSMVVQTWSLVMFAIPDTCHFSHSLCCHQDNTIIFFFFLLVFFEVFLYPWFLVESTIPQCSSHKWFIHKHDSTRHRKTLAYAISNKSLQ